MVLLKRRQRKVREAQESTQISSLHLEQYCLKNRVRVLDFKLKQFQRNSSLGDEDH